MNKTLLLRNVVLNGNVTNILCKEGVFADLAAPSDIEGVEVLDASNLAILPAFYNTHNHAAMISLRGFADDKPLKEWLEDYIWPKEAELTEDDVTRSSALAVQEMTSSGSVFFNDMYFAPSRTIDEVASAGIRACIGITVMENHSKAETLAKLDYVRHWSDPTGGRISLAMAPHAIYTVGEQKLRESAAFARDNGMRIHIHVAETELEVRDCIRDHGTTPVRYLERIGFLGDDVIAAHCIYVDEEEWDILARRGVTVAHCPCSNMKLGSGRFPFELAIRSGARITIGTDGCSSNNNLDMREEMKFAAFLAKLTGDAAILPAEEVLRWATVNGAEAFGINGGVISEGKVADAVLVDLSNIRLKPGYNLVSDWVYAADSSCISHTICDGRVVYSNRVI